MHRIRTATPGQYMRRMGDCYPSLHMARNLESSPDMKPGLDQKIISRHSVWVSGSTIQHFITDYTWRIDLLES